MSEWRRIGDLPDIRRGASPRPIGDPKYFGGAVGWVRIADVTRASRFLRETEQYVSSLGESLSVRVNPGDLVMSICGTLGRPIIIDMPACIHDGFVQFSNLRNTYSSYLFYALQYSEPAFNGMGQPGTQTNLNTALVGRHKVFAPRQGEQRRIAEILSTVDEAIEQTEALIAKYQQIKAGLMHDLFTRGLTADGRLRPTRTEAPHLYRASPLGWIPKEWGVLTLGESCQWFSGDTPSRSKSEWWNGDFPWLTPKDMKAFELSDTSEHITKEAALFGSRIVSAGTVFIVVRGMILAHSFPVVLGLKDFAFNQDIKAIQPGNHLSNRFLAYWFVGHRDLFFKKTTEATHGTKRFDLQEISKLSIGLPEVDEQNALVSQLDSISTRIEFEHAVVAKLRQQKQGLMHDLLTGRVRVKVEQVASHD